MQPLEQLHGFGRYLASNNYIEERNIRAALQETARQQISFITGLGQYHYLSYSQLAEAVADYFGLPLVNLAHYDYTLLTDKFLDLALIQKHSVLPLYQQNNQLYLATADPSLANLAEINFLTGLNSHLLIIPFDQFTQAMEIIAATHDLPALYSNELEQAIELLPEKELATNFNEALPIQAPIVNFLNKILFTAIKQRASDIHFEPYEHYYRIRYRLDGILYEINRQPIKFANYLTARLKIMANLDIAERRVPQDGRFKINLTQSRNIDFRLNTCPTLHGEKIVVRLLTTHWASLSLQTLGMNTLQKKTFIHALQQPQGLILVTGPTGSGKTITLYTALNNLNKPEVNICSVEDPIEIQLPGINQVQINLKTKLCFATALRAFLRQDPDIIMIGEIRDQETAEIAIKAAQTGHLVLSTLHTNNATETLTRLANLGIAPFNITSSLHLIIAQRLLRCLCNHCKIIANATKHTLLAAGFNQKEIAHLIIYQAQGCTHCHQGYQGRTGIYEVMPITSHLATLINENANAQKLAQQAQYENTISLRQAGLEKVKAGITSLEELNRVISDK